jgi:hypothetical protein
MTGKLKMLMSIQNKRTEAFIAGNTKKVAQLDEVIEQMSESIENDFLALSYAACKIRDSRK